MICKNKENRKKAVTFATNREAAASFFVPYV